MTAVDDGADGKASSDVGKASINRAHFDPAKRTEPRVASTSIATDTRAPVEAPLPRENRQLVQILRPDGNRTTFDADAVDAEAISGTSEVLGGCRFVIAEVDMIIFGERIEAAADLPYAAWRLRHAVEPLVAQDFDGSGGDSGTASPLVGQPAPEIALTLLDGGSFRLSQCKGQIVVLDFWASWCGPCIQTMPLTEQAMAEFDPAAVRLVAVNLEEPVEHVRGVMERHNPRAAVALDVDVDGVAARRYRADAIPQVVVVDREGNVSRVLVGGGREAVEQLKASLNELLSGE
ncbi:MAG: TlpA family protein disulfide reductase [Planctomycetaceae bacterium]|nr:TlpA family protein disulfide reductase [Planctomycetaceae bacterium]